MKLILSRKGFDSGAGGAPSPILPGGAMLSLPVPDGRSEVRYSGIRFRRGTKVGKLVEDLTRGRAKRVKASARAHLDPDLRRESLRRGKGWRPLFGQVGAARKHLENQAVGPGDLFLFFGWFRRTRWNGGRLEYVRGEPGFHALFGWLQVGRVVPADLGCPPGLRWAKYHPHFHLSESPNTLYVAAPRLRLSGRSPRAPGGGVFKKFKPELRLTAPDENRRGRWRLPGFFWSKGSAPRLSYHGDRGRWERRGGHVFLKTVARGQEFVIDVGEDSKAMNWIRRLFA